jgi:Glycosyltransferase Family 4
VRRVLFVTQSCYLDDSGGAAVAMRAAAEALARRKFAVDALTGTMLDLHVDVAPADWLAGRGLVSEASNGGSWTLDSSGLRAEMPRHYRLRHGGVSLTLHPSPTSRLHEPDEAERDEFLLLYSAILERFRPDVLVNFGGDALAHEVRTRARAMGATVVFALHNLSYAFADPFTTTDAVIVPSRFAAEYYRRTLGLECTVLSNLVDLGRVRVEDRDPRTGCARRGSRRWPTRRSGSGITAVTPSAGRMPGQTVPATRRSSTGSGDLDNPRAREPCVEDSAD